MPPGTGMNPASRLATVFTRTSSAMVAWCPNARRQRPRMTAWSSWAPRLPAKIIATLVGERRTRRALVADDACSWSIARNLGTASRTALRYLGTASVTATPTATSTATRISRRCPPDEDEPPDEAAPAAPPPPRRHPAEEQRPVPAGGGRAAGRGRTGGAASAQVQRCQSGQADDHDEQ